MCGGGGVGFWSSLIYGPQQQKILPQVEKKTDPSFAQYTSMRVIGNDQPVYSRANYQSFSNEGYIRNITAHRCIEMRATTTAGIPWHLYKNGNKKKRIDTHPLLDLLKRPNLNESQGMFLRRVVAFYALSGNSYIYASRVSRQPEPLELWALRPDRMSVVPGEQGIVRYEYRVNAAQKRMYKPEDVMHWKAFHPLDDLYGLSDVQVAATMVTQQNAGDDRNTALLQNAARPSGGLFAKEVLSDPDFERLNTEIIEKYSGVSNTGMPLLFDGDMKWQALGLSPLELDWRSSRASSAREICVALGVPSILLGDTESKTYANYETALIAYYTETILPNLDILRDCLNMWLCPMFGDDIHLDYDKTEIEALQENRDGASVRAGKEFEQGGLTFNEYRKAIGQGELEGGNFLKFVAGRAVVFVAVDRLQEYMEATTERAINPPLPAPTVVHQLPNTDNGKDKQPALPPGKIVESDIGKKSTGNTEAIKAITAVTLEAMRLLRQENALQRQESVSLQQEVRIPNAKITPIRNDFVEYFDRFEQRDEVAQ